MERGLINLHKILLSIYEFRENLRREGRTFLTDVTDSIFARQSYDLLRVKNTSVKCVRSVMNCGHWKKTVNWLFRQSQFYLFKRLCPLNTEL